MSASKGILDEEIASGACYGSPLCDIELADSRIRRTTAPSKHSRGGSTGLGGVARTAPYNDDELRNRVAAGTTTTRSHIIKLKPEREANIGSDSDDDGDSDHQHAPSTTPPSAQDDAAAAAAQQRARQRTQLHRALLRTARHAALAALCAVGAVVGKDGYIVVENGTWGKTITGLAFGILVQVSLVPIVECGRMWAQRWFARKLTAKGMKAREMLTAWSALYSGSYRGVEDFAGVGPIALFLILIYASEAVVIGAIGNLYTVVPTVALKATDELYLRRPLLSTTQMIPVTGLAYDAYVNDASGRTSDDWIRMTSESTRVQYMKDKATVTCQPDGSCKSVATGVFNPIGFSTLDGASGSLPFTTLVINDQIQTSATVIEITNECTTVPAERTEFQGIVPGYVSWPAILVPGTDLADQQWLVPISLGGHFFMTMAPEIGSFSLTRYNPNNALSPIYAPPLGEIYMLPYAYRIPGRYVGMQYLDEIYAKEYYNESVPVGFAFCKVTARTGLADVSISVSGQTEVDGVSTTYTRVDTLHQISELTPLNFNVTEGFGSAVIAGHLVNSISCSWRICPASSNYTDVPFVTQSAGYLSIPDGPDGWDYAGGLAKVAQRMSEIVLVAIGAVSSSTGRFGTLDPYPYAIPDPVSVPVQVFTTATHGRVVISTGCVAILITGGVMAVALLVYEIALYARGGHRAMAPGILITDSIYYFLKSFHDSIIHPATPGMIDPHPDELRRALGSKTFLLGQTLTQVGLDESKKNELGSVSDFWIHINKKNPAD
ncbi:hypothetical protein HDU87_007975 [Geranomyces variabilis]|uniref:Uncharacterized protein n=1 Tax=Geranomyces variabilis TaxID=109894 RepID=A0AAD5TR53_9FUNG|nr:hypothetical protein HDU87_007975 [Geranomyces variabilis]